MTFASKLKKVLKETCPEINKISINRQHYSSGGGGTFIHIVTWSDVWIDKGILKQVAETAIIPYQIYNPSFHFLCRGREKDRLWLGSSLTDVVLFK